MEWINEAGKIAGSISAILALLALILIKPIRKSIKSRKDFHALVLKKLDSITDDIADLQYERLSQAHDYYINQQGWCPTSKKAQLCNMYRSYTAKRRNHLAAHYEQDILDLPDKPQQDGH